MQIEVIKETIISVIQDLQLYNNNSFLIVIFLTALVFLWRTENDKSVRNVLVYLSTALICIYICPVFAYIGNHFDDEIYYRVWWTIPMGITFSYAFVKIMFHFKEHWKRGLVLILAIVVIIMNGDLVYTNSLHFKAENSYQLPQIAVDVGSELTTDYENPVVIMSTELSIYIRQYDSRIQVPFSRYYFTGANLEDQVCTRL